MIELDKLKEPEKKVIMDRMKKQIYIDIYADVDYMCYYLKIDFVEFWRKFLWD